MYMPDMNDKCTTLHEGDTGNITSFEECLMYMVDPETVGQYTGLEDRNGKRIYEGDIVRWMSKNTYLVSNYVYAGIGAYGYGSVLIVTALESGFTLRPINDNAPDIPNANRKIDNYAFWNHHNQLEVIGNIHDNPELMEVQA